MGIPLLYPWANRLARFGYRAAGKDVTLSEDDSRIPRDDNGLPIHGVLPGLLRWEVQDGAPGTLAAGSSGGPASWSSCSRSFTRSAPRRASARPSSRSRRLSPRPRTVRSRCRSDTTRTCAFRPARATTGWSRSARPTGSCSTTSRSRPASGRRSTASRSGWTASVSTMPSRRHPTPRSRRPPAAPRLTVEFLAGYSYAQVFAPAGQEFICFEPMTAPTNALDSGDGLTVSSPGGSYRAAFRIALSRGG